VPGVVNSFMRGDDYLLLYEALINNFYRDADRFLTDEKNKLTRVVQYGSLLEHALKSISRLVAFPTTNSSILSTDSPAYRDVLPKLLEALRSWNLVYTLEYATRQNTTKRGYNSKKYIYDTGIMNFLFSIRRVKFPFISNYIFSELLKILLKILHNSSINFC
jgi:predicted AAA+ superfamily ATPase